MLNLLKKSKTVGGDYMATDLYYKKVEPKLALIKQWARRDYTDQDIWTNLKITKSTFYNYRKKHPELEEALKTGKDQANALVENQLLNNSLGYDFVEEVPGQKKEVFYEDGKKIKEETVTIAVPLKKHKQSETNAAKLWLTNRDSDNWKDRQDVNIGSQKGNPLHIKLEDIIK